MLEHRRRRRSFSHEFRGAAPRVGGLSTPPSHVSHTDTPNSPPHRYYNRTKFKLTQTVEFVQVYDGLLLPSASN